MSRGNALELGIKHAGAAYRRVRRAAVLKQEPRRLWDGTPAGKAPVDFLGTREGRALAIEAKETDSDRFEMRDDHLAPAQIKTCDELLACGFEVWLVIDFTKHAEVYAIPWQEVARFLTAPWRSSLSLDWCRAYGLLLPEEFRGDEKRRRTLFLDGARHADAAVALAAVNAEKSAAEAGTAPERAPRASKRQLELAARTAARPHPTREREAYQEYLRGLVAEGIDRQVGVRAQENRRARAMAAQKHHARKGGE